MDTREMLTWATVVAAVAGGLTMAVIAYGLGIVLGIVALGFFLAAVVTSRMEQHKQVVAWGTAVVVATVAIGLVLVAIFRDSRVTEAAVAVLAG
jgi:hypothetical protein